MQIPSLVGARRTPQSVSTDETNVSPQEDEEVEQQRRLQESEKQLQDYRRRQRETFLLRSGRATAGGAAVSNSGYGTGADSSCPSAARATVGVGATPPTSIGPVPPRRTPASGRSAIGQSDDASSRPAFPGSSTAPSGLPAAPRLSSSLEGSTGTQGSLVSNVLRSILPPVTATGQSNTSPTIYSSDNVETRLVPLSAADAAQGLKATSTWTTGTTSKSPPYSSDPMAVPPITVGIQPGWDAPVGGSRRVMSSENGVAVPRAAANFSSCPAPSPLAAMRYTSSSLRGESSSTLRPAARPSSISDISGPSPPQYRSAAEPKNTIDETADDRLIAELLQAELEHQATVTTRGPAAEVDEATAATIARILQAEEDDAGRAGEAGVASPGLRPPDAVFAERLVPHSPPSGLLESFTSNTSTPPASRSGGIVSSALSMFFGNRNRDEDVGQSHGADERSSPPAQQPSIDDDFELARKIQEDEFLR